MGREEACKEEATSRGFRGEVMEGELQSNSDEPLLFPTLVSAFVSSDKSVDEKIHVNKPP
eukprot:scaffold3103_cov132-Skeletonema_menzelii.AAC.8